MSGVRRGTSFSFVAAGSGSLLADKHAFLFDASDFAVMMGHLDRYAEMGNYQGVSGALRTNVKDGLGDAELDAVAFEERRRKFGINEIRQKPIKSFFAHCKEALGDPVLIILMIAGAISMVLGLIEHPSSGWIEGVAILIAVGIVTVVTSSNNVRQETEFRRLDSFKKEEYYDVWRAGVKVRLPGSKLVVGDLVELNAGEAVPADGVFIYGDDPKCDEAKMTGESVDVPKDLMHDPFLKSGTELRMGQCGSVIVAVGSNSAYGRILASLEKEIELTPLQKKLERTAVIIGYIGTVVAVVLFLSLVIIWMVDVISNNKAFVDEGGDLLDFFIIAVTIIVVAIPEGLPLAVTIALAYSMQRMVEDQNLVRILAACETMGNATTICSDKTGTLTLNQMTVVRVFAQYRYFEKTPQDVPQYLRDLLVKGIVVNSKASEQPDRDANYAELGTYHWEGSQTEIALLRWLQNYGVDIEEEREKYLVLRNYPFDSHKKNSSVILKNGQGYRRFFKGAAELLLERASHILDATGNKVELTAERRSFVTDNILRMTRQGLRTIGVAYVDFEHIAADPDDPTRLSDPPENDDLTFVTVAGIKDPLRPESRRSVRQCQRAGVIVRMVTGDHLETAMYIARESGILTCSKHVAMTGEQFRRLLSGPEEEQLRIIPRLRVLARSKPEDKKLLVAWLRKQGHVVAATGDGTNDAPALKEADVGIAMNLVGTAVAKAAAEIIILDDNFASIVKSVMWGRAVYDNIRKFVQFQLTVNIVALSLSLIGGWSQYTNPLKAVQLLWVNLIMDTMAALALATEKPTMVLLERKPYRRDGSLFSRIMWRNILGHSALQLICLLVVLFAGDEIWDVKATSVEHFTIVFNTFVFFQIFNEINARKVNNEINVFDKMFDNAYFPTVLVITVVLQVLIVQFGGDFSKTTGLTAAQWGSCILIGFFEIPFGFVLRLIKVEDAGAFVHIDEDAFEGADLENTTADDDEEYMHRKQLEALDQGLAENEGTANATVITVDTDAPPSHSAQPARPSFKY